MSWTEVSIYLGIFFALVAAGFGFPIPEEVPIVSAGALAGTSAGEPLLRPADVAGLLALAPAAGFPGALPWAAVARCFPESPTPVRWWIALPLCFLGVVLSDGLLYGMGRYFGTRLLEMRLVGRLLPAHKRQHIEDNFHRYGVKILLFARLLPGIRAPIFITAGIMRLPLRRFLLADGLYAIPGVSLLFFLAFWFTNSFKDLVLAAEEKVLAARPLVVLVAAVALAVYLLIHFLRRPVPTGDPEDLPLIGHQVAARMDHDRPPAEPTRKEDEAGPDGPG